MPGLALLAFLGAGYTTISKNKFKDPLTGKEYVAGDIVSKGITWLIKNQNKDGSLCVSGEKGSGCQKMMYCLAIGTLALTEAYGLVPPNPYLRDAAQRAVNYIVDAQSRDKSYDPTAGAITGTSYRAWRYSYRSLTNDLSVTGWCVMALKSAELSGLNFDKASFSGALNFINELTDKEKGYRVGYTTAKDSAYHPAMTAVAMMSRAFIQKSEALKEPAMKEGAKILAQDPPMWENKVKIDWTKDYEVPNK